MISSVKLDFEMELTPPQLHTIICANKSPSLLAEYENFKFEELPDPETLNIGCFV